MNMDMSRLRSQQLLWILLVAVLLAVVLSFASPFFMTVGNMTNLSKQVSIVAILAAGQAIVIMSGGIDLFRGLGAGPVGGGDGLADPGRCRSASGHPGPVLQRGRWQGLSMALSSPAAGIPPFIATLGMLGIARGMALVITGGVSYQVLVPFFLHIGNSKFLGLPIPLYFVVVTYLIVSIMMHMTVFGRHVYAIGGGERVSRLEGIPVDRQKLKIYMLSGFLAALAAVVMTGRLAATPPSVAQGSELQAIAAVIIGGISFTGGRGIVVTALIGALIMAMITNGLNILGISSFFQQVLIGIVIIVAVWIDKLKTER